MDVRKPPPPRNSSRTLAMFAVAVLVVIAIGGIVLASLRQQGAPADDTPVAADATQPAASAMTAATAAAVAAETAAGPNQVVFAPGSDQISEPAMAKLRKIADAASKDKRSLVITAKVESRPDRAQQRELAQKRTFAVRGVLEENQVLLARMQIHIKELALGEVPASEANRVEVSLP
jgi:outer membrane protein OmpA-like peptidoglycan-associated protein